MRSETTETLAMWRVPALPDLDLRRATYVRQTFPRHAHERFALGVVEAGALGFFYRGENVVAPAGAVTLANPDEPHTGHAAAETGWTYRMMYFNAERLREAAAQMADRPCPVPRFAAGVIHDSALARQIGSLHRCLERGAPSALEAQSRFIAMLATLILRHGEVRAPQRPIGRESRIVRQARDFIEAHFNEDISVDQLASLSGRSPYYFMRVFARELGLPPYAYLIQTRVRRARGLLDAGHAPAAAAQAVGFCDQSHLTRYFKRLTGITPGKYRRIVQELC